MIACEPIVHLPGDLYVLLMRNAMTDELSTPTRGELFFAYQALTSRRTGYDSMLWQTPALGLTAQAFLMTLALAPTSKPSVRFIAAFLSLVLSIITMQLMAKYRVFEKLDSLLLERFEAKLGLSAWLEVRPHGLRTQRLHHDDEKEHSDLVDLGWFRKRQSYLVWQFGLALFGVTSLMIMALVVLGLADKAFGH